MNKETSQVNGLEDSSVNMSVVIAQSNLQIPCNSHQNFCHHFCINERANPNLQKPNSLEKEN